MSSSSESEEELFNYNVYLKSSQQSKQGRKDAISIQATKSRKLNAKEILQTEDLNYMDSFQNNIFLIDMEESKKQDSNLEIDRLVI